MAANNVEKFAAELKLPVETLLDQLRAAGVVKSAGTDSLTETDKEQLLSSLRKAHGSDEAPRKKITLTKRQTTEIRQADGSGKSRTIQVEVRTKRVFVKREAGEAAEPAASEPAAPVVSEQELAQREAESRRQSELLARQEAELKEKQERLEREREREARALQEAEEAARAVEATKESSTKSSSAAAKASAVQERARKAAEDAAKSVEARRAVEDEVAAINKLMTAARSGKLAATARAPEKAAEEAAPSTTLHKPAVKKAEGKAEGDERPKEKKNEKQLKASQLSSTWQDDAAKRRTIKTRGDLSGGAGG